jgi:hypothetical protein
MKTHLRGRDLLRVSVALFKTGSSTVACLDLVMRAPRCAE